MTAESPKEIAIVFFNPEDHYKAAISIFESDNEPIPEELDLHGGVAISQFFKSRNIPMPVVMEIFPGLIEPSGPSKFIFRRDENGEPTLQGLVVEKPRMEDLNWDMPLIRQWLPMNEAGLQRFANLASSRVTAFVYTRRNHRIPERLFQVSPTNISH